jgi:hypothetical protein
MLRWKIVERQPDISVLGQAFCCFGILALVYRYEQVKSYLCTRAIWGHPDRLGPLFRLRLHLMGELVRHVSGFIHPAALPVRLPVDVTQGFPESQGAITNGEGWLVLWIVVIFCAILFHIEVVNAAKNRVNDLMEDLVAILTSFATRLYGQRYGRKKTQAAIKALRETA